MVYFGTVLQAIVLAFVVLWSRSVRFVLSVFNWFRPRSAPSRLPVTTPPPPNVCASQTKLGSVRRGIAYKTRLFRGPPKSSTASSIPSNAPTREATEGGRLRSSDSDIFDICTPPPPLTITCDIQPIATIATIPLPYIASISDVSLCSTVPISPPPFTPSPPVSPIFHIVVTPEDTPLFYGDIGLPTLNMAAFELGSRNRLDWEDSTSSKRMAEESCSVGFTAAISAGVRASWPRVDSHVPAHESVRRPSLTDLYSVHSTPDAFDVNSIHDKFLSNFESDDGTMGDLLSDAEEFDWPIPPGPAFRFKDDYRTEISPTTDSTTVLELRVQSPVRPLHVVKRNAAPSHTPSLSDLSSESDESDYSPPSSPSSTDHRWRHCHKQETLMKYVGDYRSQKLTSILASLSREELITMSNLPRGTIVTLEESEHEYEYKEIGHASRDDGSGYWEKGREDNNTDDWEHLGNVFRSSIAGSSSTISSMAHDLTWVPISSVHRSTLAPTVPSISTDSLSISTILHPASPLDSAVASTSPVGVCIQPPTRVAKKPSKSIGDTTTLLESEYRRWMMTYGFGSMAQDDAHCRYFKEEGNDDEHWSDVLLIESYV